MIVKKFKSAITYFNVMISSFSPELPLVRRQMGGVGWVQGKNRRQMRGVGWVQGKNKDPFLTGTRLKFPNIVILSINHDSRN